MTAPQSFLIPCRLPNDTVINLMAFDLSGVGTGPYAFAPVTLGADGVSIVDFNALSTAQIAAINAITATIDNGVPITAAALPLPAGAATDAHLTNVQTAPGSSATTAVTVQGSASGVAVPVSASSLPLPTGASTAAQIGEVQTSPTANTVLDRLKTIATNVAAVSTGLGAVVLAAGSNVIGKVGLQVGGGDAATNAGAANATTLRTVPATGSTIIPVLGSAGNISLQTSASGSTYVAFASLACKQLTIFNDTGVDVEVQQGGAGVAIPVANGSGGVDFYGLANASDLGVRRKDVSNTQVTVKARWGA